MVHKPLRSRQRANQAGLGAEDQALPASYASIAAGCRPRVLSAKERSRFGHCTGEYLDARNLVLQKWQEDNTTFLTEKDCIGTYLLVSKICLQPGQYNNKDYVFPRRRFATNTDKQT